jgi:hypothetical protein
MPTRPRPLGNKAKEQAVIVADMARLGAAELTHALRELDRHPDTAAARIATVRLYLAQIETTMHRLRLGDFPDED